MTHFTRILTGLALAAAATVTSHAQDILVVDMNKVYADSKVGKHIASRVQSLAASDEATLKSQANSLEATGKSLQGQLEGKDMASIRQNASLTSQITDFQKRQGKLAQDAQKKQVELQLTQAKAQGEVNTRLKSIFDQIAREKNASAILDKSAVLYVPNSSSADITNIVVQRLDSQMTTVAVNRQSIPTQAAQPSR